MRVGRNDAFLCPGCARPLREGDVVLAEGFARCTACDAVFVAPAGAFGAAYATALPRPQRDLRVHVTEKRARAAGYRTAERDASDQREVRIAYAPGPPVGGVAMAILMGLATLFAMLAAHASRDTTVATGFWLSAAVFALLGVVCVLSAIHAVRASALLEVREGRVVVDRKAEHAVADIQRVHVAQRRVPASEAAAKFGKLAGRGEETTPLFDVVATVGTRGEVLATYATADRAILAEAALADALGHAPRATANVRDAVDALPGRPRIDALDADAVDDGAERGRSLGTRGGGNDSAR